MRYKNQTIYFSKLFKPVLMLALPIIVGVVGYSLLEGYSLLDALYMTVITISTVGYEVVKPLSATGKLFTIVLILINVGLLTYFITLITRYLLDGEFIKRYKQIKMENNINNLRNHVIICGFGRNGKESAHILQQNNIPFVIIESKDDWKEEVNFTVEFFIKGNGTQDEVLLAAGIEHAKAIITTLPVDADNLFLVLSAKQLNPGIKVISRASIDSSVSKLKIAGADNVIMPDKIGGAHMATLVLQPDVTEILSIMGTTSNSTFRIVELPVQRSILLSELDLWKKTSCTIIGVKNENNHYRINPDPNFNLMEGQSIIIMGSEEQIEAAKELMG